MNKVKEQIKFDFANNCFDVLRLYSAFYVMTLHIFRHIRLQEVSPVFDWWNGVVVLFCISGFLVPASMERSKNTWEFLKKRVLRIIPSLWVCIIVGVIVAAAFCGFVLNKTGIYKQFRNRQFPSKPLDNDIYSSVLHYYRDNIQIFKKSKIVGMDICNDTVNGA